MVECRSWSDKVLRDAKKSGLILKLDVSEFEGDGVHNCDDVIDMDD